MTDIMITVGADLSPATRELKKFEILLRQMQSSAATEGKNNRVPVLPDAVSNRILNPVVNGTSKDAIKAAVDNQAKLVALKLKEYAINQKLLTGREVDFTRGPDRQFRNSLRLEATSAITGATGVKPKGFNELIAKFYKDLSQPLEDVPVARLADVFKQRATTLLNQIGGVGTPTAVSVDRVVAQNQRNAAKAAKELEKQQKAYGEARAAEIEKELAAGRGSAAQIQAFRDRQSTPPIYGPGRAELDRVQKERDKAFRDAQKENERIDRERAKAEEERSLSRPIFGPGRAQLDQVQREYDKAFQNAKKENARIDRERARAEEERLRIDRGRQVLGNPKASAKKALAAADVADKTANIQDQTVLNETAAVDKEYLQAKVALIKSYNLLRASVDIESALSEEAVAAKVAATTASLELKTAETLMASTDEAAIAARAEGALAQRLLNNQVAEASVALAGYAASEAQGVVLNKEQQAAKLQALAVLEQNNVVDIELARLKQAQKIALLESLAVDEQYIAGQKRIAELNRIIAGRTAASASGGSGGAGGSRPRIPTPSAGGGKEPPKGFIEAFRRREGGDLGALFGRGFASTLQYTIPSLAFFAASAGIGDAVKDAEELNVTFTKIQSQLDSLGRSDAFPAIRKEIVDLSKETGIAANIIGDVRLQLEGAFGDTKFNPNDLTGSSGGLKGSDQVIRYGEEAVKKQTEAAAKLSVVTGISQQELVDGLTAASIAFGASADRIGDVAVKLETATGVKAKETIAFLGDIGPSAQDAGFSLEEFAAIAAQVQKRSGQAGSAIAEQMGRILAAVKGNKSQFLDIANSNKDALGANYKSFVENIQKGNTKGIFTQLASSYDKLNQSSKDLIVNLIGGQRQANTLLAAFGDSAGLQKSLDAANSASGELEKRFQKLQGRISVIITQIKARFNELVKAIIDSGLGDAIVDIFNSFKGVLGVLTQIVKIISSVNDALGGVPAKVLAIGAQVLILKKLWTFMSANPISASIKGNIAENGVRAAAAQGFGMAFPNISGAFDKSYRSALERASQKNLPGISSAVVGKASNADLVGSLSKTQRAGAAVKGAGSALLSAVGGPAGLGLTAAIAAYGIISSKLDEDRQKVEDMRVRAENSNKSADEMIKEAEKMRGNRSAWYEAWHKLFDVAAPEDILQSTAISKQFKDSTARVESFYSTNKKLASKAAKQALKNAQKDEAFQVAFRQKAFDSLGSTISVPITGTGTSGNILDSINGAIPGSKDFFNRILGSRDNDLGSVIKKFLGQEEKDALQKALKSKDPIGELLKLKKNDDPAIAQRANEILKEIDKSLETDPRTAKLYAELQSAPGRLLNATTEQLGTAIEDLQQGYDSGQISLNEYVQAAEAKIAQLQAIAPEDRQPADIKALGDLQKALNQTYEKAITSRQEEALAFAQLYGASDTQTNLYQIRDALKNLSDPRFKNANTRSDIAKTLIQKTKDFYINLVGQAKDLEAAQKLISEGFKIPAEARQALFQQQIEQSDLYIELKKFVQNGRTDPNLAKRFNLPDKGPGTILKDFLTQYFSDAGVSPDMIGSLQTTYDQMQSALSDASLSETDKNTIRGYMKFIAELLGLVAKLPTPDANNPMTKSEAVATVAGYISKKYNPNAFGIDVPDPTVKFNPEEQQQALDKLKSVQDAKSAYAKALAKSNAIEIAKIEQAQADADLKFAQAMADGPEKDAAIFNAMAAKVQADTSLANAIKSVNDSKIGLAKAIADANGDTLASAEADINQAQKDLEFALSQNDQAGANNAKAAIVTARETYRRAVIAQRDAQAEYLKAAITKDDPVLQAQFDLNLARIQESEARGATEKANAALRVLEAERSLRDAMSAARQSIFTLREAQLQAMDDEVGAANVAAQAARAQLQDAIARGAGQAEINQLRAQVITADKSARDTLLQTKLDDYKYLLDTGKITKSQYIAYLEAVQQTLQPGTKQFKDLELTLRQLKNDIGSDLQANLPTLLQLPTLYEVRRLNQTGQLQGTNNSTSIGYQDLRTQNINITIGQNLDERQIVSILSDALGTGRNSNVPSRY